MSSMPMNQLLQNPYGSKGMLRDIEMFFGRTDVLRHIYSEIRDSQCLSLVGSRRIGKSSVLGLSSLPELQKRLGYDLTHCLFAFIDLEERVQETVEDFLGYIMKQLVAQNQAMISLKAPQTNNADTFRNFLDEIKSEGCHPVLLLDEFDSITMNPRFDYSFFSLLRAQANAGKVSYITASKESLDKVCHEDIHGSPFFNIFSTRELGPLTQQEAVELITQPSQRAGKPFTAAEVEWILKLGGHHPFFIHRTCYYLFEQKISDESAVDLKHVAQQVYAQLHPHFKYTWEHMDSRHQELLQWEARREQVSQRKMPVFSESSLFREFVRKVGSVDLTSITIDDLCKMMDELSDLRFLGESKLGYLNLVYLQVHDSENISTIEKGLIVDKLLQSVVEQLRPKGAPQDAENDWRLYNILIWRHRDKIQNEEIAARLGIGLRHFYRERKRAAKALLLVLMKMEISSGLQMEI